MGGFFHGLFGLMHPHYIINVMLAVSFYILKSAHPFCYLLFEDCELELREWELLTFLGCIVVLKNRKQPSFKSYVSTVCMFGKILGTFLYFRQSPLFGTIYIILCFLHIAFLPEPSYSGPDNVIYFRGSNLQDELERDKRVTWIVEFYAAWAPNCVNFASTFAELSGKYQLDNLKFGKIDASTYGEVAKRFGVSTSSFSKQLPTIILFQNAKEVARRPQVDNKGWVAKFVFNKENVVREFSLNDVYHQCKQNPIKRKGTKQNLDAPTSRAKPKTE